MNKVHRGVPRAFITLQLSCIHKQYFMLTFVRLIVAVLLIALITPQTLVANALLRRLSNSNLFVNYGEAKSFLTITTWTTAILYLLLTQIS